MKTIEELWKEGKITTMVFSRLTYDLPKVLNREHYHGVEYPGRSKDFSEWLTTAELTIKDIFDLFTDEQLLKCRNIGPSTLEKLKSLM